MPRRSACAGCLWGMTVGVLLGLASVTGGCTGRTNSERRAQPAAGRQALAPRARQKEQSIAETQSPHPKDPAPDRPAVAHPFPHRVELPELPNDLTWLNTAGPLRLADLRGKFVLMDFWTYCCINCMHLLPELKKLEQAYPNQLVVIGVHSAKFDTEQASRNVREAVLRYEIRHPVINDANHQLWKLFGVHSWPTLLLIDPEGRAVWGRSGEVKFRTLDKLLKSAIPYYRARGLLDEQPIHFDLLAHDQNATPLRFPGKVLADEASQRLFIADSNHNRIVVCSLAGQLIQVVGSGAVGCEDGDFESATFHHPQGMALRGDTLYVADTENHLIRAVDLAGERVQTIAGVGEQASSPWPASETPVPPAEPPERWVGKALQTALNSPWALWTDEDDLYIAMAGSHQIWRMSLEDGTIGPYAGNGREDIVDGLLLPEQPYQPGYASFAQPSGLTSDGTWLFVADSEGSSIRAVPFDPANRVRTVVGTSQRSSGRLFHFGDADGPPEKARLQHPLGVVYHQGILYVADTYNNKIKAVDASTGQTRTFAGTGKPGHDDHAPTFDEPAGISCADGKLYVADTNNHRIRTIDLQTRAVQTLEIVGLTGPPTTGGQTEQRTVKP